MALVGLAHDARLEQPAQAPAQAVPVLLVPGHLEHAGEGHRPAHRPVLDVTQVGRTPRGVVGRERHQRRQVPAGRQPRHDDAVRVAAVVGDVALDPRQGAHDVLDLGGPGVTRREAVVARDDDPAARHELVQHRTPLLALVAEGPRPAVDVEDHRGPFAGVGRAPHVEAVPGLGAVAHVAHELHRARVQRDLQRRTPPGPEAVLARRGQREGPAGALGHRPAHDGARGEGDRDQGEVLERDAQRERGDQPPQPRRARPAPPAQQAHEGRLDHQGLDRELARGPPHREGQRREDAAASRAQRGGRREDQPRRDQGDDVGHAPLWSSPSTPRQTP